ncbi:hypothetical protein IMY05_004G0174000 [Salix suchowensis]|nr:hypothetical protein IMY05_004G0174000 [Salix suchowensis]
MSNRESIPDAVPTVPWVFVEKSLLLQLLPALNHDLLSQDSCLANVNLQLNGLRKKSQLPTSDFCQVQLPFGILNSDIEKERYRQTCPTN